MPTRRELANAIRALSMDAVQRANSGHPGAPMGMADIAEVLWREVLKFNPGNPLWPDRDRFVLSNGHASMLLYSVLHLTGYPLSMEEIKNFRQWGSKTAGHPERELHLGIETTTGPLGQGFANAVGMAVAERSLAATFNRPSHTIVDHHTYVFMGDGCMMEGVSHEAASFAGNQRLGKLICAYDDNGISIDGKVQGWFTDNTAQRFEAYGWHVISLDGQDGEAVAKALALARAVTDKPSLICARTTIGWGAPNKQGTAAMHGEAMGNEEIAAARERLGWTAPPFEIPAEIRAQWDRRDKGAKAEQEWRTRFQAYEAEFPALAAELERRMAGDLPQGFDDILSAGVAHAQSEGKSLATRQSSNAALNTVGGPPEAIVIATGSEVGIAAEAVQSAQGNGRKLRLVSMPSTTTFDRQDQAYQDSVLPPSVTRRVAVEAAAREPWWRYVGLEGRIVGIDHFGASAPAKELFRQYGFTVEHVLQAIDSLFT
jgi:transketolase